MKIPVLLQGGWQDGFLRQTVAAYARLADRGADVALTMGPWTHAEGGAKGGQVLLPEAIEWLDAHLAGSGSSRRTAPVNVFVNGPGGGWRELPAWPPATTEHAFHPGAGNVLGAQPADAESVAEFTYDPADPTPTYGGAYVSMANTFAAGWKDDSDLAKRSDLLTFTSEPLTAELEVAGAPVAEVSHSSDNPFADLFVRLSEVDAKGRSRNIADGMLRLDPSSPTDLVRLELDPIAHRFARGSRIRLTVAGARILVGSATWEPVTIRPPRRGCCHRTGRSTCRPLGWSFRSSPHRVDRQPNRHADSFDRLRPTRG